MKKLEIEKRGDNYIIGYYANLGSDEPMFIEEEFVTKEDYKQYKSSGYINKRLREYLTY